jgi:hypothetical protein
VHNGDKIIEYNNNFFKFFIINFLKEKIEYKKTKIRKVIIKILCSLTKKLKNKEIIVIKKIPKKIVSKRL